MASAVLTHLRQALGVAVASAAILALAAPADAYVYWANTGTTTIGRARLDASSANQSFITGANAPCGVAVNETHVYWVDFFAPQRIGRANLDGTGANHNLISSPDIPCGVAVDNDFLYWSVFNGGGTSVSVARSNLDGSAPNHQFIPGPFSCMVAVHGPHLYWAGPSSTIVRANLDGTGVDPNFITGANLPCGVAADDTHVYWANRGNGTIGRANINGTGAVQNLVTGASSPCGVAVDDAHLYWANQTPTNAVGRANLDGSGVNHSFIPGANGACGVAVDAYPDPTDLSVACSPATASLAQPSVCEATVTDTRPGGATVPPGSVNFSASTGGGSFDAGSCALTASAPNQAKCHVTYTPDQVLSGARTITAGYAGELKHDPAQGSQDLAVTLRAVSSSLSCSPDQVAVAQTVSCRPVLADIDPGSPTAPAGRLFFSSSVGSGFGSPSICDLGSMDATRAICEVQYTPARRGTHSITVAWPGDALHVPGQALATVRVAAMTLGDLIRNRRRGTATLTVNAPGPGAATLSGRGLAPITQQVDAAGQLQMPVSPTGKTRRRLRQAGSAKVPAVVSFDPAGADQLETANRVISLAKRR